MKFRKIGTRMVVDIVPIILIALIVLTIISSVSSNNLVENQTNNMMRAQLSDAEHLIKGYLDEISAQAETEAKMVANTYKDTELKEYEKIFSDMLGINDMVIGTGIWFEPYVYDSQEKYVGPYAYKDGDSTVITYDYSNAEYDYLSQEYYIAGTSSDKSVITDPYYDSTSAIIMSTCAVPIIDGGKTIGCISVDTGLSEIEEAVDTISVGETGKAMLLSGNGVFLAGYDEEKIQNGLSIVDDDNTSLATAGQEIMANEGGMTSFVDENGEEWNLYYHTISDENWKIIIRIKQSELRKPILQMINKISIVCIVAIVVAILIIIRAIGGIAKSIQKVQNFAKNLAGGDFTIDSLDVLGKDEIAQMSESLNEMYGNNKHVIGSISEHAVEINDASEKLKVSAQELKIQFDKIADVMNLVNGDMMNVSAATEELTASVDQVNQSTEILDKETKDSLVLSDEIQKRAEEIGKNSQDAFDKANTLRENYESKLEESISQSKVVEQIGEMASVISDIAEQITLLSLNASIEAARAGEQGKGFAVVATEIGKLAGETAQSVERIQDTIKSVQDAFEGLAVNAKVLLEFVTDTVTPDYKNFVNVAGQYGEDADSIKATSEKLSSMTGSIQTVMSEITAAIQNIAESTQNTAENSTQVMEAVESVSEVVIEVNEMADKQNAISEDLSDVVHNFKLATLSASEVEEVEKRIEKKIGELS